MSRELKYHILTGRHSVTCRSNAVLAMESFTGQRSSNFAAKETLHFETRDFLCKKEIGIIFISQSAKKADEKIT